MSENCTGARMKRAGTETDGNARELQQHQQKQFHLLQLTDDIFLVLFLHQTHLSDAFHLGSTCRQLYALYRKSLTDRRSLLFYREGDPNAKRFKHTFKAIAAVEQTKANLCSVLLPDNISDTFFADLFTLLPNLVSLELADTKKCGQTLPHLLVALRSAPQLSGRLQTLTLALDNFGAVPDFDVQQPLQLPALKHLTLYLGWNESTVKFVLSTALLHSVLPLLSSFWLYSESNLLDLMPFVGEHVLSNAQLAAAVNTSALQLAVNALNEDFLDLRQLTRSVKHRPAFACITSLYWIDDYFGFEGYLFEVLPLLVNLKKVSIFLSSEEVSTEVDQWYPRVLTVLATLPQLEEVVLINNPNSAIATGTCRYLKQVMPVLPTVRFVSLNFSSTAHVNPVEVFHLAHCFPRLQQISVSFKQFECDFCDYKANDVKVLQKCVLRMAPDLLLLGTGAGWQAQVKLVKMKVKFPRLSPSVKLSSLANLVAGIKDQ